MIINKELLQKECKEVINLLHTKKFTTSEVKLILQTTLDFYTTQSIVNIIKDEDNA